MFIYGVLNEGISEVKADNNQNLDRITEIVDRNSEKLIEIGEDVSYIRGKIDKIE
jgi:hypothetical protein